jgi:hypothetical protein
MRPQYQFSVEEINLLQEALTARAARHESMAKADPRNAGPHERRANDMRALWRRLETNRVAYLQSRPGSVQCPHCKWGFHPSVIEQHIREKHSS